MKPGSFLKKWFSGVLLCAALPHLALADAPPVIAAASSLRFVLTDIAKAFTTETGLTLRLSFGSSGNLARQIAQGGPYQMFLSADETYVINLAAAGRMEDAGRLYAYGRLALFIAEASPLARVDFPTDYGAAFGGTTTRHFAIANPVHAPYGRAARQALVHAGLWTAMEPSLLYGENVSQAAQFAVSGSADGGLIAHALALRLTASHGGSFRLIPTSWHAPLDQRMALVRGAGETARKFYAFMAGEKARKLLSRQGFMEAKP